MHSAHISHYTCSNRPHLMLCIVVWTKMDHVTDNTHLGIICHPMLLLDVTYLYTKFVEFSLSHSRDMKEVTKYKIAVVFGVVIVT